MHENVDPSVGNPLPMPLSLSLFMQLSQQRTVAALTLNSRLYWLLPLLNDNLQ